MCGNDLGTKENFPTIFIKITQIKHIWHKPYILINIAKILEIMQFMYKYNDVALNGFILKIKIYCLYRKFEF
jgi:hypothetical protein